jgi:glycine hydroxymethyltransferase
MKDQKIEKLIKKEKERLDKTYNLIASENLPSEDSLQVLGSFINYKYTEGFPGKRYYCGNKWYDKFEELAIERAKKLFKCKYVNVQPLSGAIANIAVISYLLKPGEKILSMKLSDGGHLTHGSSANFIGKNYKICFYSLDKNNKVNYNKLRETALKEKPKLIISGATCYSRKISFKKIGEIAKEVGAYHIADISHIAGLCVTGFHQSPINYADIVTSTTHKTLRGVRGAVILSNKK